MNYLRTSSRLKVLRVLLPTDTADSDPGGVIQRAGLSACVKPCVALVRDL